MYWCQSGMSPPAINGRCMSFLLLNVTFRLEVHLPHKCFFWPETLEARHLHRKRYNRLITWNDIDAYEYVYIYLYVYKYVPLNSYGSYPLFLTIPICTVRQGAYFEQMLLLPCVLGEFRSKRPGDGGTFFVCRMADHRIEDSRDEALDRGYGWMIKTFQ